MMGNELTVERLLADAQAVSKGAGITVAEEIENMAQFARKMTAQNFGGMKDHLIAAKSDTYWRCVACGHALDAFEAAYPTMHYSDMQDHDVMADPMLRAFLVLVADQKVCADYKFMAATAMGMKNRLTMILAVQAKACYDGAVLTG